MAVIQGVGALAGVSTAGSKSPFPTAESMVRNGLIPIGLSIVLTAGLVSWLGWWPSVLRSRVPARRWVRIVPTLMLTAAVLGINYPHLAGQKGSLVLALIWLGVFVGVGEELMFRGLQVQFFRRAGFTEGKVALYSSLIFGLVHLGNAIGRGALAIGQALIVATSGYFFYLCLRVAGTVMLPMAVHGLWDFSLLSNLVGPRPSVGVGVLLPILVELVLIVLLLVRRRRIEPAPVPAQTRPAMA